MTARPPATVPERIRQVRRLLRREGFDVSEAASGQEAKVGATIPVPCRTPSCTVVRVAV